MAHLIGYRGPAPEYMADLGLAMELTSILRTVGDSLARGRIYLPLDEIEAFGYSEAELHQHTRNSAFRTPRAHLRRLAGGLELDRTKSVPIRPHAGTDYRGHPDDSVLRRAMASLRRVAMVRGSSNYSFRPGASSGIAASAVGRKQAPRLACASGRLCLIALSAARPDHRVL